MKINELVQNFEVYTTNEESKVLKKLTHALPLSSFSEREKFIIESLIRKSLVIKIGMINPKVVANNV